MNPLSNNGPSWDAHRNAAAVSGEDTLRLIAGLPTPEGLEDRVKAGLRSSAATRRTLMWRGPLMPAGGWMYPTLARGAAAAAIVCAVAGGGWQIYSRVQPAPAARVIVPPSASNGFSNANAVRVPETLQGPVLKHQAAPVPEVKVVEKMPAQPQAVTPSKKKQPHPRAPLH